MHFDYDFAQSSSFLLSVWSLCCESECHLSEHLHWLFVSTGIPSLFPSLRHDPHKFTDSRLLLVSLTPFLHTTHIPSAVSSSIPTVLYCPNRLRDCVFHAHLFSVASFPDSKRATLTPAIMTVSLSLIDTCNRFALSFPESFLSCLHTNVCLFRSDKCIFDIRSVTLSIALSITGDPHGKPLTTQYIFTTRCSAQLSFPSLDPGSLPLQRERRCLPVPCDSMWMYRNIRCTIPQLWFPRLRIRNASDTEKDIDDI